jgi:hypothetical protein
MLSFTTYLQEQKENKGLTIFDIDETLFQTFAKIKVVKDGKTVRELDNQEFNTYKLKDGESFDFGQFKNAELFNKTSQPIRKMLAKAKAILKNAKAKGSKVIIMTARADFDDKKKFLDTFRKYGIQIDDIYVVRAGNLGSNPSAENKKVFIKKYLDSGEYSRIRFFDDAESNLKAFNSLRSVYPDVKFEAYLVMHNGTTKIYKK